MDTQDQQSPTTSQPSASGKSLVDFLDAHKTDLAAALVMTVGYFYPPAAALVQAYPDLSLVAVGALIGALRSLDKHPGWIRRAIGK